MRTKQISLLFAFFFHNVSAEGSAHSSISGQSLEKETSNDCDMVITEQFGELRSPRYPSKYPRYSRCVYSVKRFSADTCEVKLTMEVFEVARMTFSNCSADFLELQNRRQRYKLCGKMPAGAQRFLAFPDDSDWLTFRFQSTFHQMRGFSIQVKQLPFSCKRTPAETPRVPAPCKQELGTRSGRIRFPPGDVDPGPVRCTYRVRRSEDRACAVQLDFSSFEVPVSAGCESDHLRLPGGQLLCGVLGGSRKLVEFPLGCDELDLEFVSSADNRSSFDIHVLQLPGPCEHRSIPDVTSHTGRVSAQCDQTVRESRGRITSPGFPSAFGPNYSCTYRIFRPDPSVCRIELDFQTFGLGRHNPPGCGTGSFLELPGRNRLCQEEHQGTRMILKVSQFEDPVVFQFRSDARSSGPGFDIILRQIPDSCPGYDGGGANGRCYQEVSSRSGHFGSADVRRPNLGPAWCEWVVRRAGSDVCRVRLQVSSRSFLDLPCAQNFIHLPGGGRMCVSVAQFRDIPIPEGSNYITLVYYSTTNPQFHLFVEQLSNSCESPRNSSHR